MRSLFRLRFAALLCCCTAVLSARAELKLICPGGYLPGVPFTVRVEARNGNGAIDRELWDAEAILSADAPSVTLSTNRVILRNGLGTALLTINGGANFNLGASLGGDQATRAVRFRGGETPTAVSGELAGTSSSWSGLVNVTGSVIVPDGHALTLQPDAMVILSGTAGGTSGTSITVNGRLLSLGTEEAPVTITSSALDLNWGQIRHAGTQSSIYEYTFISKAGRAPGEGHTGTGPALRLNNTTVVMENSVISDLTASGATIGKGMMASESEVILSGTVMTRARMGPEIASTGLLCTNSYFVDMDGPDDADGIYLHNSGARSLRITDSVFASGDDDAIDTLDATVLIENSILRDWPNPNEDAKGVSGFHGEVTLRRCLIVNCFVGVSTKSSGALAVVRMDHCTVHAIERGVSAATKSNAQAGHINIYLTNSIVRAADSIHSDFGAEKFIAVTYNNLGEIWPGSGNITADPFFAGVAASNFRVLPGSPCLDAGDPLSPLDPDGSRTDMGYFTGAFLGTPPTDPTTNLLVNAGAEWRYLDDGSDQASAWIAPGFDHSTWKTGLAELGYGDGDERTIIGFGLDPENKYITSYFRRIFEFHEDAERVQSLQLHLLRDDGAIVYLNGQEIHRVSMPAGAVDYRTLSTRSSEYNWETTPISAGLLREGTNLLAVEIHQGNEDSTDLSFDLALFAILTPPANERPNVAIVSPAAGTIFSAPGQIKLSATASDPDGVVTNVSYYASAVMIGTGSGLTFAYDWLDVSAGEYLLTAVARDNRGTARTSAPVAITITAEVAAPVVALKTPPPGTVTNLTEVSVTFTKPVIGVDASDLLIDGVPALAVRGDGTNYVFNFPYLPPGVRTVTWAEPHRITDTLVPPHAFDPAFPGSTWEYEIIDSITPKISRISPPPGATVPTLTRIEVEFTEPVMGVDAADLLVNSVPALSVTGSGAGPYVFTFAQLSEGPARITWTEEAIFDSGSNPFSGEPFSYRLNSALAGVVINEIMYHPVSKNGADEYIELFNRGATAVDLGGWRFSRGVQYTFTNTTISPGGYLVVAANLARFRQVHPGVTNAVGNWTGSLSNSREDLDLDDALGNRVDSVYYADDGAWARRRRGDWDRGYRGWRWFAEHDGLGSSLELINPAVSNNTGQNWGSSAVPGGTPGELNSIFRGEIPPFIEQVRHAPFVPRSSQPVMVTARISLMRPQPVDVSLAYRVDGTNAAPFISVPMHDDGSASDSLAGDGLFAAMIPPQTNNAIVEFYLIAETEDGLARTWPAPALDAPDGAPGGQFANALYQVDDAEHTNGKPFYKIIMTEIERRELQAIGNNSFGSANSDAQMNATFISIDGMGLEVRYLTGVRNRGHGTRADKPNNFRVNFRSDEPWKGVLGLNLNAQYTYSQVLGAVLHIKSGNVGAYSHAAQVRVNNANPALTGGLDRTYGFYAANEVIDADWANRHFPNDSQGNVYRALRDLNPPDFDYRTQTAYPFLSGPENKNSYTNTWFKVTNESEDDWTDLIGMLRVFGLNGTEEFKPENVERVIDTRQWLRYLAVMNLLGSGETSLTTGHNDDYYMYRGVNDPRFVLMYYDLDQILGINRSYPPTATLFTASTVGSSGRAFARFLNHPEYQAAYYEILRELVATSFSAPQFNAAVDQVLGDWVPPELRSSIIAWMDARRVYVLSQLPPPRSRVIVTGAPRSPTPRNSAIFQVSGEGVTHYQYSLNEAPFGLDQPVENPIVLSALSNGSNILRVVGRTASGMLQSTNEAAIVRWVIDTTIPSVRLNELLASRSSGAPDQIELFNDGDMNVNLTGLRLSDNRNNPGRFTFPAGTLAPGAFLVLDATQLGFSLSTAGEGLYLFDRATAGGALLDSVEFGQQLTDFSIGRIGHNGRWFLTRPSLGSVNFVQMVGDVKQVRITEWLAAGLTSPQDFMEIHNPHPLPVDLGALHLTDNLAGDPTRQTIAPLNFLAAGAYRAFTSGTGLDFGLSADQGEIALVAPDLSIIDSVVYPPQNLGVASGLCPDGGLVHRPQIIPTPGAANLCAFAGAGTVTINELLANGAPGWLELFNNSSNSVNLAGMSLSRDAANPSMWNFPGGSVIAPGGYFVIQCDDKSPASASNTGFALATNSGSVLLFDSPANGGALLNSLSYGWQIPGRSVALDQSLLWTLAIPTPGGPNQPAPLGSSAAVKINEWMANPVTGGDWIELYNPGSEPVDLSGFGISDTLAEIRFHFPSLSFIGGGTQAFLTLYSDADRLPFALSAEGELLVLSDSHAAAVNVVTFGPQTRGVSQGRLPDGSAALAFFPASASPGASNRLPTSNDSDGDGLPDDWEEQFQFDPSNPADGALDSDQDGLSNHQEYLAGTSPRDAQSNLTLSIANAAGALRLQFPARPGRGYDILGTDSLNTAWRTLLVLPSGEAARLEVWTVPAGETASYFQIRLHP